MADVETKLRIAAVDTSATAFRTVAAQIEQMTQRVTKSQRHLSDSHKTLVSQFEESASKAGATLNSLTGGLAGLGLKAAGVSLGIGAIVEAGKKAVTIFATVDERARALAVSTGRSKEAIAGFYERVKQVAGAAAIDVDTLYDSFDDLARAIGPEKAAAALPRLAVAAKAMNAPIADVVSLMEQMNDNLDITVDKAPAAFDMIQKGTEGTRTTAAGATKGLADLSLQMRGLGEGGEKGLRSTLGLLIAIGKHAPSTEAAVASLQSLMNKVGTRKTDENIEKFGRVPMTAALNEAKRKHQDEFLVFLNEVDKALTNMATDAGTPVASKMQYLQTLIKAPEDRQAIQSILESMPEYRAIRDRTPAQEAGATDKAFETMRPSASSFLTGMANAWREVFEFGGRAIWGAPGTLQHQSTDAEKRPDLAAKGLLPGQSPTGGATLNGMTGGPFKPISGSASDIPWMTSGMQGARPLIPSEPGSSTERTAREQLEALRRLERASLFSGGLRGGFSAGEATGSGGHGGTRRGRFGHPSGGGGSGGGAGGSQGPGSVARAGAGSGTPDGPPEPAGKGGYRGGATPHNLDVFMKAAEDQLRKEGVPEANVHAAASVLAGNAVQESKLNPNAVHDQGTGYGIYGARLGRRDKMLAWLSQHGYAKNSLEGQARYMAHEGMSGAYPKTRRALMGAAGGNLGSATSTTMREFEAPKPGPGAGESNRRGAASTAFGTHRAAPDIASAYDWRNRGLFGHPHDDLRHRPAGITQHHAHQIEAMRRKAAETRAGQGGL
jgi:hypothetical protein